MKAIDYEKPDKAMRLLAYVAECAQGHHLWGFRCIIGGVGQGTARIPGRWRVMKARRQLWRDVPLPVL